MSYARGRSAGGGRSQISFGSSAPAAKVSSNKYSNGANQNCGNVITDRPSTRVHAPAGGHSQISFGSYSAPARKVSSNKYSNGANQNCGNVITDRPSTRVHAPAGGHSQISFGSYAEPMKPTTKTNVAHAAKSSVKAAAVKRNQSSNAFSNGANQNCGNVITDRPSTRVHAPPGGRSQITF